MSSATPITYPSGQTIRWRASDMTILDDNDERVPVLTGDAVMTFAITELDGTVLSSGAGVAANDDWHWDADTPLVSGTYWIEVRVTDPANWKGRDRFNVEAF